MRRLGVLFALLASLALGGSARAFVTEGTPWPKGVITYYNAATDQAWAVERAVTAWNSSGANVHFVATTAANARVRIEHFPKVPCTVNAEATVGYTPVARVWVFQLDQRSPYCNSFMAVQSLAHELGHVLGLGHETQHCALMNPSGSPRGPSLCTKAEAWQWRCRLLTPDDVAGAIAIYGGTARPQTGPTDCDLYKAIAPPKATAAWTGAPQEVRLSFKRPQPIGIPVFLAAQHQQSEGFAVAVTSKACATDWHQGSGYRWDVQPGQTERFTTTLDPGTHCVALWSVDGFGRPSDRPATLWLKT